MTSSLVGSEMCIRDSTETWLPTLDPSLQADSAAIGFVVAKVHSRLLLPCLLYTSDAADDM
eukprot:1746143-Prorocentrum_lima.AAC.1